MTLAYACIAPHGGEVIPGLAAKSSARKFRETTRGMRTLAREITNSHSDTIVIASPHNLRLLGKMAVVTAENSFGSLEGESGRKISLYAKCNTSFAMRLIKKSKKHRLPVVGANFGTASGETSNMPMDWGTLVPLWFVLNERKNAPNIVIISPSREIPLRQNYMFGRILGQLIDSDPRSRIVFIASADQAHAHSKSGPYGYSPRAAEYDRRVLGAVRENRLNSLLRLDPDFVEKAKPDSLWQMVILAGITSVIPCESELVSYQVPTYYGMLCASFRPV